MSNLSKKLRQQLVLEALKNGKFDRYKIARKYHVHERTIRRDLNEIAESMGPIEERRLIVKQMALNELPTRIPSMSNFDLIKLAMLGEPQKFESTEKVEIESRLVTLNVTEDEDDILNKAARILDKRLPSNKKKLGEVHH